MRFLKSLATAGLAGLASAATSDSAEVYVLSKSSTSSSTPPQISRQLAKHIFVNRLGGNLQLADLELASDFDEALSHIAHFGKAPKPLFGEAASATDDAPSQLLAIFEGITEENSMDLRRQLRDQSFIPAFTVADVPSTLANDLLVNVELSGFTANCDMAAAINPYASCWDKALAVKYDLKHNHVSLQTLVDNFHVLRQHIANSDLEATLVLLPESTRASEHKSWAAPTELRRRAESVLDDSTDTKTGVAPGSGGQVVSPAAKATSPAAKINLGCFTSLNSCSTATANCTGHGVCVDKYAASRSDGQEGDRQCFVCSCKSTRSYPDQADNDQHTHWGGAYCQKIDVSSPFWLLAGTSILLVGIVTGTIGLLFSVGEEKLPGVIGAGVSRSK